MNVKIHALNASHPGVIICLEFAELQMALSESVTQSEFMKFAEEGQPIVDKVIEVMNDCAMGTRLLVTLSLMQAILQHEKEWREKGCGDPECKGCAARKAAGDSGDSELADIPEEMFKK